jgi:hypothetical protein
MATPVTTFIEELQQDTFRLERNLQRHTTLLRMGSQAQTSGELPRSEELHGSECRNQLAQVERARHAEADWKQENQSLIAKMGSLCNSSTNASATRGFLPGGPEHSARVKNLVAQIDIFLSRTNTECVECVFKNHADQTLILILPDQLSEALSAFGVHLSSEEVKALATTMDVDKNGGLDLTEFAAALRQVSTPVEQFVQTLPIHGMLASCLATPKATDPLKELCKLGPEQLNAAIDAFSVSVHLEIKKQLDFLSSIVDAQEAKAQEDADGSGSKSAVFVMNAGTVKDYYEGMYERIGELH